MTHECVVSALLQARSSNDDDTKNKEIRYSSKSRANGLIF
jgi:hypothetical protein